MSDFGPVRREPRRRTSERRGRASERVALSDPDVRVDSPPAMSDLRVQVNPIACVAHASCAELLPERITLDEWGYPIVDGAPVPAALVPHARRAVNACPTLALRLDAILARQPT
jgi:ferredoxin